jgi:hypothetical protein
LPVATVLDCVNGAPKLPDYSAIAAPVPGNLAFNYADEVLVVYGQGRWCQVATD